MARRGRRNDLAELPISHVVACSPCFEQYLALRRNLVLVRTGQVGALCVVLFFAVLGAFMSLRSRMIRPLSPSIVQSAPQAPEAAEPQRTLPLHIQVDLAAFSPVRGDGTKSAPQEIHLPAKPLRITFLLPVGMEPVEYTVRLLDSAGKAVLDKAVTARLTGGAASFAVDLNLEKAIPGKEWTLLIREPGLSWRKYPVMID